MKAISKIVVIQFLLFNMPLLTLGQTDSLRLEEIKIIGKKQDNGTGQVEQTLTEQELNKSRGLSLGETIKNLPGVSTLQTGPTLFKPVIQGLYGQRILILNNDIRLESQQWGTEHAPEIDTYSSASIKIIKGAASVRYGSEAIGGAIIIDQKPFRKETGVDGVFNLNGFSANRGVGISGLIDYKPSFSQAITARLQGSLRKFGNAKTPNYFLKNTGLEDYNFSYAINYAKKRTDLTVFYSQYNSSVGIFSGSHIGNLTDLYNAINSAEPLEKSGFSYHLDRPYQKIVHELLKCSAVFKTKKSGVYKFIYALQYNNRQEFDAHEMSDDTIAPLEKPNLDMHLTTHSFQFTYDYYATKGFNTTIGVSGNNQENVYKGRLFIPNFESYSGGVFFIEQWENKKWQLEVGVRYDYKWMKVYYYKMSVLQTPEYIFSNLSGTVGAQYYLTQNFRIKSNLGTAFRPPHVSELFSDGLHHGSASVEIGNQNLKSEYAFNASLSPDLKFNKGIIGLNIYYNSIPNYIFLKPIFPATLTIQGAFPTFQYAQIHAEFFGVDCWLQDTIFRQLNWQLKASFINAYNKTLHQNLINSPPSRIENGFEYNFKKSKNLNNTYIGISIPVVFRKTNLPEGVDYTSAPNGYFLLNAKAGTRLVINNQSLDIHFSVNNILNTVYRDYLDRFRYFADAIGRNFTVNIHYKF